MAPGDDRTRFNAPPTTTTINPAILNMASPGTGLGASFGARPAAWSDLDLQQFDASLSGLGGLGSDYQHNTGGAAWPGDALPSPWHRRQSSAGTGSPMFDRMQSPASDQLIPSEFPSGNTSSRDSPVTSSHQPPANATPATSFATGSNSSHTQRETRQGGGSSRQRSGASQDRSRSTGIGKAPSSTHRSRSARRSQTTYQAAASGTHPASGNLSGGSSSSSSQNQNAAAHSAAMYSQAGTSTAIAMPATAPVDLKTSHGLAMSMPSFPSAGFGSSSFSASNNDWASSSTAQAIGIPASEQSASSFMTDPSGWRPSVGHNGVPSSAPTFGVTKTHGSKNLEDVPEDPTQKHAALLTEKRRKRRESHNAVERRRRDNINDRISELAALIPAVLLESASAEDAPPSPSTLFSPQSGTVPLPGTSSAGSAARPNKGVVLQKSVEYIRHLQTILEASSRREDELQQTILELRQRLGESPMPPTNDSSRNDDHVSGDHGGLSGGLGLTGNGGHDLSYLDANDQHSWLNVHIKQEDPDMDLS